LQLTSEISLDRVELRLEFALEYGRKSCLNRMIYYFIQIGLFNDIILFCYVKVKKFKSVKTVVLT